MKENDTEPALAADAYLTFIAIIHQVYIQQCFFTFDTHLHPPSSHPQMRAALQFFNKLLEPSWHGSMNAPEELIKTVTDPDPGPSFISFTTKWGEKKEWRSVFEDSYTPFVEDIKAEPIAWILSRRDEDKTDGRENWFRSGSRPGTVI